MTQATAVAANPRTSGRRRVLSGFVLFLACLTILVTTVAVWTHQVALNTEPIHVPGQNAVTEPAVTDPIASASPIQVVDALDIQGRPRGTPPGCDQATGRFARGRRRREDRRAAQDRPPGSSPPERAHRDGLLQPRAARPPVARRDRQPEHRRWLSDARCLPGRRRGLTELQSMGLIPANVQLPDLRSGCPAFWPSASDSPSMYASSPTSAPSG